MNDPTVVVEDLVKRFGTFTAVDRVSFDVHRGEVIGLLLELVGADRSLVEPVPDRKGHDRRYALDDSKIRGELGWAPTVDFESGLHHTVDWYRSHGEWMRQATSGEYQEYYDKFYVKRRATLAQL